MNSTLNVIFAIIIILSELIMNNVNYNLYLNIMNYEYVDLYRYDSPITIQNMMYVFSIKLKTHLNKRN